MIYLPSLPICSESVLKAKLNIGTRGRNLDIIALWLLVNTIVEAGIEMKTLAKCLIPCAHVI